MTLAYTDFRPGHTWQSIRDELSREQLVTRAAGQYMFVSRGTVLGRWHQRKQESYRHYLRLLAEEGEE